MEAGRQRWRTGWTDERKDEVGRGEEETVFCREGMKEGRGKISGRFLSTSLWLDVRERWKKMMGWEAKKKK